MKNYVLFVVSVMFLLLLGSVTSQSFAQSNANLHVSAENRLFENHFAGPMVIEVKINDSVISSLTGSVQEPNVTVNDKKLTMVQAVDAVWYGYFAAKSQAQIADSHVGAPGYGLDFGEMCSKDSSISGLSLSETSGFTIPRDISSGSNGEDELAACTGEILSDNPSINNVVRNAPKLNPESNSTGQKGIHEAAWPLIQLFDIVPGNEVSVKYKKSNGIQLVILTFDEADKFATMKLDKSFYRINEDVKIDLSDIMLNIDPTDEDSWTWTSITGKAGLYYRMFDENGGRAADGPITAVNINDEARGLLSDMMFDDNGRLILNPVRGDTSDPAIVVLKNNDYVFLKDWNPSDNVENLGTETLDHTYYPITFTETTPNSGSFVNYDKRNVANLMINPDAKLGGSAIISYNGESHNILVKSGTVPVARDFSERIPKDVSALFTVIANSTDPDGDTLKVVISDTSDLEGSAKVNSNNTITFTPVPGFLDKTSFEYTVSDGFDGSDTGVIDIIVGVGAILASIDQINVDSDRQTYGTGDTIKISWAIPGATSGTDTIIRVTSPIGTNAFHEVISEGTKYSIPTDDYDDGMYTIRIEHGQYYGETQVSFLSLAENTDPVISSAGATPSKNTAATAKAIQNSSCAKDPKITVRSDNPSYVKGEKIFVSVELCDVISNEYAIIQIFDRFNNPVNIDQILPQNAKFNKQYSTDGGVWKLDGTYVIRATYLNAMTESTFDFIVLPAFMPAGKTPDADDLTNNAKSPIDGPASATPPASQNNAEPASATPPASQNNAEPASATPPASQNNAEPASATPPASQNNAEPASATPPASQNNAEPASPSKPGKSKCGAGTQLKDGLCTVITTTTGKMPKCGAGTELRDGLCTVITTTTGKMPKCGAGTELRDGLCTVIGTGGKSTNDMPFYENILRFFKNMFN